MLNFGGPWTLSDVRPFLYRLFVNPRVLVGIPAPLRQLLAFTIAQVKGPSSVKSYRSIGGGSPQLKWTATQAANLRGLLDDRSLRIEIGMRSAEPSIQTALQRLKFWGATDLVLLPLFPQFSTTTTGTCFDEVDAVLKELQWQPRVREIRSWADHPIYIRMLQHTVAEAVSKAEARSTSGRERVHVIFSAHSLPLKIVKLGDEYPFEIERTVAAVTRSLKQPWSLAFQSRNGRLPWLQPYLEDELKRLGAAGLSDVVVVPISFVSDHIETLFELDQLYAGVAKAHGITNYQRARCFNDDPLFAELLQSLLLEHAADVVRSEKHYETELQAVTA